MTIAAMADRVAGAYSICYAEAVDEVMDAVEIIGTADYPEAVFEYIADQYRTNRTRLN